MSSVFEALNCGGNSITKVKQRVYLLYIVGNAKMFILHCNNHNSCKHIEAWRCVVLLNANNDGKWCSGPYVRVLWIPPAHQLGLCLVISLLDRKKDHLRSLGTPSIFLYSCVFDICTITIFILHLDSNLGLLVDVLLAQIVPIMTVWYELKNQGKINNLALTSDSWHSINCKS